MIWRDLPNKPERYGWAFYYYLLKRGDKVMILKSHGKNEPLTIQVVG